MASQSQKPFVSVLTPTYNRTNFIPAAVECYKAQTYPHDHMEWLILDDGTESVEDLVRTHTEGLPNIRYIRLEDKRNIGEKRNILNREAKGDILVSLDDDDFYPPERVSHVVQQFQKFPTKQLAGSSIIYMYYTKHDTIIKLGPYAPNHATNGTLAVRASYAKTHLYNEYETHAEEVEFLENYIHPMIQLDPMKVMLVMSHSENTFDKERFLKEKESPFMKRTPFRLRDFVKDKSLREFYEKA
jgi:glycosyltransferase involved in cell wall biosynthesis